MTLGLSAEQILARNKAAQKAWRAANPERMREHHKKCNAKPETKERKRLWAIANREVIRERTRARYAATKAQSAVSVPPPTETLEDSSAE